MTVGLKSLRNQLILRQLLVQLLTLAILFVVLLAVIIRADSGGAYTDEALTKIAAGAVVRAKSGELAVQATPELARLREERPSMWFVARDDEGRHVTFGEVPAQYQAFIDGLGPITYAEIRDREPPYRLSAVVRRETGVAGDLTILGHGKVRKLTFVIALAANTLLVPVFLILGLLTASVTYWIVRRSLRGLDKIAHEAEEIDVDRRGKRLTESEAPREIAPLVRAMNAALSRLDEGYERQGRFIAAAAHELRTPIAILQVKLETADAATARRLSGDVVRLATLAEQLLDLHRLDDEAIDARVDLGALARRVAADLAPLLIATDKTVEVTIANERPVLGNAGALERVVTNLVQNAVEHGGRHVVIRIAGESLEVEDDGPGIPFEQRERVFEPFHRVRPRSTGSGLGLSLVRQVVGLHGGRVRAVEAPNGGAIIQVDLSPWREAGGRTARRDAR